MLIPHPAIALKNYKNVELSENTEIRNYIETYRAICRNKDYEHFLETDIVLQKMVKLHHLKIKLNIILFNMSIYAIIFAVIKGIV